MGGPRVPDDVQPYLERIFADPDIIQLPRVMRPFQPALARWVARRRAPGVKAKYVDIGTPRPWLPAGEIALNPGASPLCATTDRLAAAVEKELASRGRWRPTVACYRYVEPSGAATVEALRKAGADEVLAVTLYPQWSSSTTGSSVNDLARACRAAGMPLRVVDRWGVDPGYLALAAADAQAALDRVPAEHQGHVKLLFSAHGLPQDYVDRGDPYEREVRGTAEALAARLTGYASWDLAFQSKVGPVAWLKPYSDEFVRENGKDWSALVVVPLGFVSDHIETLYDTDVLLPELAKQAGVASYTRARMFNDRPAFVQVVADLVERAGDDARRHEPQQARGTA